MVQVKSSYSYLKDKAKVEVIYHINGNGVLKVDYSLDADSDLPDIPKVGMTCGIKDDYRSITWYGRGLLEKLYRQARRFRCGCLFASN